VLDELVTIPMAGRAESLNVAMAGTLFAFECARRRHDRPTPPRSQTPLPPGFRADIPR